MRSIGEIVREAETNYTAGVTQIGDYVDFSLRETIEKIIAYLNSKHTTGDEDSLGRAKPFFNIVSAAVNIWYRATDIDRKNIKFIPETKSSIPLAFIANVMMQNWMDKNRFGQFLNSWGRSLARYGSSVPKFVEKNGELIPTIVPWNRIICDAVDFDALPRIEKFYKTPAQLKKMGYDKDKVDDLINALQTRKTLAGANKDIKNEFIELYEVHGELDTRLLEENPDLTIEDKKAKYSQQMHVVSFIQNDKEFDDFTLYKGKEAKDPYIITHLIEEDGRVLAIGAVEYLFEAQWMQNHTVKNMKDILDLSSKLIFQTSDPRYVGRNVLSAIETGDIMIHGINQPLTQINNSKADIVALQNFGAMWRALGQEITATPDAMRGITPVSGTPLGTTQLLAAQAGSLFEIMVENKGLHLEDILKTYVIPHLKKKLKNKDEILAILDAEKIKEIDGMYVPKEAIKRYNQKGKEMVFSGAIPQPFNPIMEENAIKQEFAAMGNKRSFTPDDLEWDEVMADFEWDNIRVEITNENTDKIAVLQVLNDLFKTIAVNPAILQDENAKMLFNKILTETAVVSPLQFSKLTPVSTVGGGVGNLITK